MLFEYYERRKNKKPWVNLERWSQQEFFISFHEQCAVRDENETNASAAEQTKQNTLRFPFG